MTRRDLRKKISVELTLNLDRKISVTHPLVISLVDIAQAYSLEMLRAPKVLKVSRGRNQTDRHKSMVDEIERNL